MARITGEVVVDTSITEVSDTAAERTELRYNRRIVRAEMLTDEPAGAGSRVVAEPKGTGGRGQMALEIVEYRRPYRLHNVGRSSYLHLDGMLTFAETRGGTRLRWDWTVRLVGPVRALTPVLMLVGPRWGTPQLERPRELPRRSESLNAGRSPNLETCRTWAIPTAGSGGPMTALEDTRCGVSTRAGMRGTRIERGGHDQRGGPHVDRIEQQRFGVAHVVRRQPDHEPDRRHERSSRGRSATPGR